MNKKKDKERTIFDCIYSDRVLVSVTPTEEPDFKVKNTDVEFGVEITEFYFSQSDARLRNIPGYFDEILDGKGYRDKNDIASLKVEEITIMPRDNRRPSSIVNGIVQQMPTINEYISRISELIEKKNNNLEKYTMGLNHVNLIILDREHRLAGVPKNMFHHLIFQPQLEEVLMNVGFREIFLITHLGESGSYKRIYIPLKMLFLVAEIHTFNNIMMKEYPDKLMEYSKRRSLWCAEYLNWRGAKNVYFKGVPDGCEVVYGNSGIFISKDRKVRIRDYSDFALPEDFDLFTTQETSGVFDGIFLRLFEKYKREYAFSAGLCFDVSENSQLETNGAVLPEAWVTALCSELLQED